MNCNGMQLLELTWMNEQMNKRMNEWTTLGMNTLSMVMPAASEQLGHADAIVSPNNQT